MRWDSWTRSNLLGPHLRLQKAFVAFKCLNYLVKVFDAGADGCGRGDDSIIPKTTQLFFQKANFALQRQDLRILQTRERHREGREGRKRDEKKEKEKERERNWTASKLIQVRKNTAHAPILSPNCITAHLAGHLDAYRSTFMCGVLGPVEAVRNSQHEANLFPSLKTLPAASSSILLDRSDQGKRETVSIDGSLQRRSAQFPNDTGAK